ncbi:MAG: sulfur carrier protein ThiS [Planctomycetes bacterium]|nr:sulfur carrier protein ThiS [Planctomycetota bacterium]
MILNGQPRTAEEPTSVADLLSQLELEPVRVAVEINEDIVPRKRFGETPIHDGDRIEIVTFVGGG